MSIKDHLPSGTGEISVMRSCMEYGPRACAFHLGRTAALIADESAFLGGTLVRSAAVDQSAVGESHIGGARLMTSDGRSRRNIRT